jgi:hypothetical protein
VELAVGVSRLPDGERKLCDVPVQCVRAESLVDRVRSAQLGGGLLDRLLDEAVVQE